MNDFNTKVLDKAIVEVKHIFGEASRDYNCVYCHKMTKQLISFPPYYEEVPICNSKKCIDWICNAIVAMPVSE